MIIVSIIFLLIGFVIGSGLALLGLVPKIRMALPKGSLVKVCFAISSFFMVYIALAYVGIFFTFLDCYDGGYWYCGVSINSEEDAVFPLQVRNELFFHIIIPPPLRHELCFTAQLEVCDATKTLLGNNSGWSEWDMYLAITLSALFAAQMNFFFLSQISRRKYKRLS